MKKFTVDDVKPLLGDSWSKLLYNEFNKLYMIKIMKILKTERKKHKILPDSDKVFRAYKETSFENCKVCVLGQDPYPNPGNANGLAFSVDSEVGESIPGSLINIFKEIENDFGFKGEIYTRNPDLSRWAKQGVLLLNTSLTVRAHRPGSHSKIGWSIFTGRTIELLSEKENMIFLLWGNQARLFGAKYSNVMKNNIIECAHPSPLSAHKGFFNSKCFSRVNNILSSHFMDPIDW